ncbi:MAG TPA: hypothetical protein VFB96_18195 [Pirellulaceae bacterium]|nr:hypothetical protein [Pirellulaceae bacterium]
MVERELDPGGTRRSAEGAPAGPPLVEQVLGYLNFSSGAADGQFLANLNALFAQVAVQTEGKIQRPTWKRLGDRLRESLAQLTQTSAAFRDAQQAAEVVRLVFDVVLPTYRRFHSDLLFHHSDDTLFRPFFIGRVCEAVLAQGPPWTESDRIAQGAIDDLNDFLGHRPVAALESQKIEPYAHEYVRPIPLFIRGSGVSYGAEREVVTLALKLLEETDADLLRAACFDPAQLEELAIDPRAYDFDHPANKRPNYHFGQWDPHQVDKQGRYRRFVVQQVTLDALMQRLTDATQLPAEEVLFEAAAVLAGTILMASGISGDGPGAFDSSVTLARLLPRIARYRDEFYERLFNRTSGEHAERLKIERDERRQPFGGARQHLNAQLARRRASQLEHVHLARIFARMGHVEAAKRQAHVVPCASARMLCQIDCLLATGDLACDHSQLEEAADYLPKMVDLLKRGIECGAIIDPWNILGFDANFSLFPALENSVRDHRADELVALMERILAYYSRLWSAAAAEDQLELCQRVAREFKETASWWHKFAVHEVSSVEAVDALVVYRAAERVAQALNVWHKGGAAAGDVAFWAPHVEMFDSPKAYTLVVDALLDRRDYVASMALLMHWLSQASQIGLERSDSSFHDLAQRWFTEVTSPPAGEKLSSQLARKAWDLTGKFLDYLEANADDYWSVPEFSGGNRTGARPAEADEQDAWDEPDDVVGAAYDDVVFRGSTEDDIDSSIFEDDDSTHDELLRESRRVADRLAFLATIARLWRLMVVTPAFSAVLADEDRQGRTVRLRALERWLTQARENRQGLARLLVAVKAYSIPQPQPQHDSLVEYDRRRMTKESLLERIVTTSVETADASRMLEAAIVAVDPAALVAPQSGESGETERMVGLFARLLRRDTRGLRGACALPFTELAKQPLLYVPLAKGGNPQEIVAVRTRQRAIQDLLSWLPRLGLWAETNSLLEIARQMERDHPVGPGAVTEFDELFKIGYKGIVESLVASAATWSSQQEPTEEQRSEPIVSCLEQLTESMLTSWLSHSRTLRLSILERVLDKASWKRLVEFIERYGEELFTQRFLNLGNIRAILHQGTANWLEMLEQEALEEAPERLMSELGKEITREEAGEQLALVLEAIVENYGEYRDYNSTTTQSDRGELLYMLLDFLRLRTKYDRVCWNLKPVVLAHEILVRRGQESASRIWRKALTDRIHDEAEQYLARLGELQKKYAMRMPTVADRLAERFVRPLTIDRIRALVKPAVDQIRAAGACPKFELLEEETELLTREPTGVGLDVPAWLVALEEEVEQVLLPSYQQPEETAEFVPQVLLSLRQVKRQLKEIAKEK